MLRLKLKGFLRQRGLTEVALADAVAEVFIESGQGVSERHLRYVTKNTDPITQENRQRNPSLVMLGRIIEGLRYLTGEDVDISDVLEYIGRTPQPKQPSVELPEDDVTQVEPRGGLELVPLAQLESDEALNEIRELVVQSLKDKGFSDLGNEFERITREDKRYETTAPTRKREQNIRRTLTMLVGLLFVAVTFILYDQFILKPQIIASYTRLFTTRDRVRPTSSLPVPTLIGPEGSITQLTPSLRVAPVEKAVAYEFYVENTVSEDYVYTGPVITASFPIPSGTLCPNTTYTWRARALGNDGWTSISSPLTFTVTSTDLEPSQQYLLDLATTKSRPLAPVSVAPIGTTNTTTPTLEVEEDPDVYGYGFYIRDLQSDGLVYDNNYVTSNVAEVPEGVLKDGGIYQWNVRSRNCHFWSDFSQPQVFTVNVK
jgi:hypothetical protein